MARPNRPIAHEPALRVRVVPDRARAAREVAAQIAALARGSGGRAVLGLATGASPAGVYAELVREHRERGLDLARVATFNLDEYLGLPPGHPATFRSEMERALFGAVNVRADGIHFLPSEVADDAAAAAACERYEQAIRDAGGVDLQLLGIGRNGHLAFNEPGSERASRTRLVELDATTRADAAGRFARADDVPRRALTMGIATILEARRLRVLAFGAHKAEIVRRALVEPVGPALPATYLREHPDVELWLDREAAARIGLDEARG